MVLLDLVAFMTSSVKAQLSPLSEPFSAPVHTTNVRLLVSVNALVLLPVLVQCELLVAEPACILLLLAMDQGVTCQTELRSEDGVARLALVNL